jgi:hypothetical protein
MELAMPKPKLSAALNNCALHALVPAILEQVQAFAINPNKPHKAQYESLKNAFAEFYGFDKNKFSFDQFSKVLNNYNAYDSQIVLGPVLREFMKSPVKDGDDEERLLTLAIGANEESVDDYIRSITEMVPQTARYESLSPQEVALLVGKPLGIEVAYSTGSAIKRLPEVELPLGALVMHHSGGIDGASSGGHWELTSNLDDIDISVERESKLQRISSVFSEGDASLSQCGLVLLKTHVQLASIGATPVLQQLDEKAVKLINDLIDRKSPNVTTVSQWALDLQIKAAKDQEITNPNSRVLSSKEKDYISTTINNQRASLGIEQTARYKAELENLFSKRDEIQEKAAIIKEKGGALSDEELATQLQAEEFDSVGFKP